MVTYNYVRVYTVDDHFKTKFIAEYEVHSPKLKPYKLHILKTVPSIRHKYTACIYVPAHVHADLKKRAMI